MESAIPKLIKKHPKWEKQLILLQQCALDTGLQETIKWGIPTFTFNNKNVVAIAAFKFYAGLWFFEGALLEDKDKMLVNAQEGKTKMQRQWRFTEGESIPVEKVKAYLIEAIRMIS